MPTASPVQIRKICGSCPPAGPPLQIGNVSRFEPPIVTAHPWCPPRPVPPPNGFLAHGETFVVPGIATVTAAPHRSRRDAKAFARRIASDPAAYLDVLTAFGVPGVTDCRPVSHARGGTDFPKPARGRLAVAL